MKHVIPIIALAFLTACGKEQPIAPALPAPPTEVWAPDSMPGLISPNNGQTGVLWQTPFVWSAVPGAVSYHIEATVQQGSGSVLFVNQYGVTGTSYQQPVSAWLPISGRIVYWKVRAEGPDGTFGPWSWQRYFYFI